MRGGFAIPRGDGFTSRFPPAYAALAAPFLGVFGPAGMRLPAALGVAACSALLTSWLLPAVGRRWALGAGLALGLATPLFFYGVTVWEHSLTVALCLGAWLALERRSRLRLWGAGAAVGVAIVFREELALMGVALAAACALDARRPSDPLWLALGALPPVAALGFFNHMAYGTPFGPHLQIPVAAGSRAVAAVCAVGVLAVAGASMLSRAASRRAAALLVAVGGVLAGVVASLWLGAGRWPAPLGVPAGELARQAAAMVSGYASSTAQAGGVALAFVASLALGAFAGRRARPALLGAGLAGLGIWLWGSLRVVTADQPLSQLVHHNGLVVHLPLACLAGVGGVQLWRRSEYAPLRIGAAAGLGFVLLATLAALVSQRGLSGVHWAPRWLLPGVPALVVLAVAALREGERTSWLGRGVWALMVGAGLLSSALASWLLTHQKLEAERLEATLLAQPVRVVVSSHPLLADHLAGLWQSRPLLWVSDEAQLLRTLRRLPAADIRQFALLVDETASVERIGRWQCRLAARQRGERLHYFDLDVHLCELGAGGGRPRSR